MSDWPETDERITHIGQNGNDGAVYSPHREGFCCVSLVGQDHAPECKHAKPAQSSGGDNDYWVANIADPKRLTPYKAECEDIIEYFQMTFQEGEAFKALWRNGMLRLGMGKPGDTAIRNAEKVSHFGDRMIAMEKRKEAAHADT